MEYTIILDPDAEGTGYAVRVPALPGCITQGASREGAKERAKEAIAVYIESLGADGEPIRRETQPVEVLKVAV